MPSRNNQRRAIAPKNILKTSNGGSERRGRSRSRSRGRVVFNGDDHAGTRATKSTGAGLFRRNADFMGEGGTVAYNPRFSSPVSSRASSLGLPPVVASYIDPFSSDASGVRYPDPYQGFSDTATVTAVGSIVTSPSTGTSFSDANMAASTPNTGCSLMLFTPDPSNFMVQGVAGTPTVASGNLMALQNNTFLWPNGIVFTGSTNSQNAFAGGNGNGQDNAVGSLGTFRLNYTGARMVSGGVKLTSTLNFSTVSGTIHVAPVFVNMSRMTSNGQMTGGGGPGDMMVNGWQVALPNSLNELATLPGYKQYPLSALETDEVASIFSRCGEEALLFKPTGVTWGMDNLNQTTLNGRVGDSNVPNNYGHYCICVFVDGVTTSAGAIASPLTPIMEYEYRAHYECQANPNGIIMVGSNLIEQPIFTDSRRAAPYQPLLQAAIDNLSSAIPAVRCIDEAGVEETKFVNEVVRVWRNVVGVVTTVKGAVDCVAPLLGAMAV